MLFSCVAEKQAVGSHATDERNPRDQMAAARANLSLSVRNGLRVQNCDVFIYRDRSEAGSPGVSELRFPNCAPGI